MARLNKQEKPTPPETSTHPIPNTISLGDCMDTLNARAKKNPGSREPYIEALRVVHQVFDDLVGPGSGILFENLATGLRDLDRSTVSPLFRKGLPAGKGVGNRPPICTRTKVLYIYAIACVEALAKKGHLKSEARALVAGWLNAEGVTIKYANRKITENTLKSWENDFKPDELESKHYHYEKAVDWLAGANNTDKIRRTLQDFISKTTESRRPHKGK